MALLRALLVLSLVALAAGQAQPGKVDNGVYIGDDDFASEVDNVLTSLQEGGYSLFAKALANSSESHFSPFHTNLGSLLLSTAWDWFYTPPEPDCIRIEWHTPSHAPSTA